MLQPSGDPSFWHGPGAALDRAVEHQIVSAPGNAISPAPIRSSRRYRDEPEPAFVGMMSSVYVWAGNDWRLALYQQTPMRADDA